jgi:transcriptional regulator with XRE-family HTH domain
VPPATTNAANYPSPDGHAAVPADTNSFAVELKRWRDVRGYSRASLARAMRFDRSYVSKVESGAGAEPSESFAQRAETVLHAGGALRASFREFERQRPPAKAHPGLQPEPSGGIELGSLVVDHDDAALRYDDGVYRLTQWRRLVNGSTEPITRYLIRISVDRYPGDPERSNRLYSQNPLTWDEIALHAWHGEGRRNPMDWTAHHDRDAFKEVWLLFYGEQGHFPLYPGESTWIEYEYTVPCRTLGRLVPTRRPATYSYALSSPRLPCRPGAGRLGPANLDDRASPPVRQAHRPRHQRRPTRFLLVLRGPTPPRPLSPRMGFPGKNDLHRGATGSAE